VRSGFLTLLFAGLGIILTGLIQKGGEFDKSKPYIFIMLLVSTGISIPGCIIDINYVRRKFRVIRDLDNLFSKACLLQTDVSESSVNEIMQFIRVSGDSGDQSYNEVKGYPRAYKIGLLIYFVPILLLWVGWLILLSWY
jgi:hypothetical protein